MNLNYSAEDLAFRDEVRAYLDANLPADLQHKVLNHKRMTKDDFVRWHKILAEKGWVATAGPNNMAALAGAPPSVIFLKKNAPAQARRASCRLA